MSDPPEIPATDDAGAASLPGSPVPYLLVEAGLPPGVFSLPAGEVVAGRSTEAGLQLRHPEISRRHCRFSCEGGACRLEDVGSRFGTQINGRKIEAPTRLQPGDQITLGPVQLRYQFGIPPVIQGSDTGSEPGFRRVLVGGQEVDQIDLTEHMTIGRADESDVRLTDPTISRRHALLQKTASGYRVVNVTNVGDSLVNGRHFDEHDLVVGDQLQFGAFFFEFDGQHLNRIADVASGRIVAAGLTCRAGELEILSDVSAAVEPREFVGVIGPSGAGKSTFLNALSGMRPAQAGKVWLNGVDFYAHWEQMRSIMGYVPQEDIVHGELTVQQALTYAARLRLPRGTPANEIQKLIARTLEQLGLEKRVGTVIASLSGGQRKRVSIAVELLGQPEVLFLDEPTSGLDPATEFKTMELLRHLAATGRTIICTTHVMENAYLLDQLIVLMGGRVIFAGSPQKTREYFEVQRLTTLYDKLEERPAVDWSRDFASQRPPVTPPAESTAQPIPEKSKRALSLPILLLRQWSILRADLKNFLIIVGQPLLIAMLVAWVTSNHSLMLFFAYLATLWFGCSNAAQEIVKELPIYRRERLVGLSRSAYLLSKYLLLGAMTAAQAMLLFLTMQLAEGGIGGAMGWQIAGLLGISLSAVGIGLAISACARSAMQAVMLVPLVMIPQILFSGYTVKAHEMKPAVARVSQCMPTFAAQTVMDTSLIWRKEIARSVISDYWDSFRNLNRHNDIKTGEIYSRARPAWIALATQGSWVLLTGAIAWLSLKGKERS